MLNNSYATIFGSFLSFTFVVVFVSKYVTLSTTAVSFNLPRCYPLNRPFATNDHMVQNPPCWSASSLLFPHWDIKTKASQTWLVGLFVLTSQFGFNNELALQRGGFCAMWSFVPKGLTLKLQTSLLSYDSHGHVTGVYKGPIYDSPRDTRLITELGELIVIGLLFVFVRETKHFQKWKCSGLENLVFPGKTTISRKNNRLFVFLLGASYNANYYYLI